jgi:predicted N-acyltransferase
MMFHIEEISTFETLLKYETAWNSLLTRAQRPSLYLSYEWLSTWWKCHATNRRQLWILAVFDDNELIAIAPLQIVHSNIIGFHFNKIEFLSMAEYADHPSNCTSNLDFIVSRNPKEVIDHILNHITSQSHRWDFIRLHPIASNSVSIQLLEEFSKIRKFKYRKRQVLLNSWLHFTESWDAYFQKLSKRFRKDLRSSEKELKEVGEIECKEYRSADESTKAFDRIMAIEKESWKWNKGIAINSVVYKDFYRTMVETAAAKNWLRLWILMINEKPIAYDLCVDFNGSVEALKKGYVESYRRLYPGGVLEWKMLEQFSKDGVHSVNFQWGDVAHKSSWSTVLESHEEIFIFQKKVYPQILHFILFGLNVYSLSRISTEYYRRVLRKIGIHSHHSELTRMDQIVA